MCCAAQNTLWCNLLNYYKDLHLLVEGANLDTLQEANVQLPKPKPLVNLSNPVCAPRNELYYEYKNEHLTVDTAVCIFY